MLTLTRKPGEAIAIGDDVLVEVLHVRGTQVRIAIRAPDDVMVLRSELAATDAAKAGTPGNRPSS